MNKKMYDVKDIMFSANQMSIKIDGKKYCFGLKNLSSRLWRATPAQRRSFKISPSGYGIHWPLIDEDLSIHGLLTSQASVVEATHQ